MFLKRTLGNLWRQKILGTQIKLHTYSNVLSVVQSCFISGGRESADAYLQLAYPPSRHIQIPTGMVQAWVAHFVTPITLP